MDANGEPRYKMLQLQAPRGMLPSYTQMYASEARNAYHTLRSLFRRDIREACAVGRAHEKSQAASMTRGRGCLPRPWAGKMYVE